MTEDELNRIEGALSIQLPASYRTFMSCFPIPAFAGNSELELWDDPDALIRENMALRTADSHAQQAWPPQYFCVGNSGGSWVHAIDLEDEQGAVWYVDNFDFQGRGSGIIRESFTDWAIEYIAEVRSDLEIDGLNPDDTPEVRKRIEEQSSRVGCRATVILIFVVVVAFLALAWLFEW